MTSVLSKVRVATAASAIAAAGLVGPATVANALPAVPRPLPTWTSNSTACSTHRPA